MILVTIREAAEKRGITTPYQLAVKLGFAQSLAARLWKGESLPKLETLNVICSAWRCGLASLVRWVPDEEQTLARSPSGKK